MAKWSYCGDVHLTEGGYFWKQDWIGDEFAEIVEVTPDSIMGGADNVFHIYVGSVYIPNDAEKRKAALECVEYDGDPMNAPIQILVEAFMSYWGMEQPVVHTIRIGKVDPITNDATIDEKYIEQISGNWKLANYVKKEFLRG